MAVLSLTVDLPAIRLRYRASRPFQTEDLAVPYHAVCERRMYGAHWYVEI